MQTSLFIFQLQNISNNNYLKWSVDRTFQSKKGKKETFLLSKIAKAKPQPEVPAQIERHVKPIESFMKNPKFSKGKLQKISARDVRCLKVTFRKNPGATS